MGRNQHNPHEKLHRRMVPTENGQPRPGRATTGQQYSTDHGRQQQKHIGFIVSLYWNLVFFINLV
jgi:hypothetical protein